ncbi:Uncharacterised protein [Serratia fonticola]|nr:Uncharacterised protein [Serratia fonticola]
MIKRTFSIFIAEHDRYFAHEFCVGLNAFCYWQEISLHWLMPFQRLG